MKKSQSITSKLYSTLDDAYSFFNDMLFSNELPEVVIVLQRKGKNNLGYFHPERFANRKQMIESNKSKSKKKKAIETTSELSLNPDNFSYRTDEDILSTLVHEMCHVWQHYKAEKKSRGGYHDKVWGKKMKEIGLHPSNTGAEGGKETGQQMTHYILKDGKFKLHCQNFLKSTNFEWNSLPIASNSSKRSKTTYVCPACNAKIWGKPNMKVQCLECEEEFEEV